MRWYWIDRFIEFESGRYAKAIKNLSLAEDYLHDHFPHCPMIPNSLVIEGMAQTGGLLVCEHNQFTEKVVLAKVPKAVFYCAAVPGDTLTYTAKAEYIRPEGAMVTATSYKGDILHAEAELVFAHLNDSRVGSLFDPETFLRMMRLLGAFEVGHAADGSRLRPPKRLVEAAMYGETPAPGERDTGDRGGGNGNVVLAAGATPFAAKVEIASGRTSS